jgi:hypothetical protein
MLSPSTQVTHKEVAIDTDKHETEVEYLAFRLFQ